MFKVTSSGIEQDIPIKLTKKDRIEIQNIIVIASELPTFTKKDGVWKNENNIEEILR